MIGFLRGRVLEKQPNRVLVDVQGVGYDVHVPLSTYYQIGDDGAEVSLRVHTHVREESLQLFGFATGPGAPAVRAPDRGQRHRAQAGRRTCCRGWTPRDLLGCVQRGDVARLTGIPGIGKKTAERIVLELKDRVANLGTPVPDASARVRRRRIACGATCTRRCRTSAIIGLWWRRPSRPSWRPTRNRRSNRRSRPRCANDACAHGAVMTGTGGGVDERLVAGGRADEDAQSEAGLRPRSLDEYIGQDRVRANLQVSIAAAKGRRRRWITSLLYGPPGLGKTTLAYVIGTELGVPVRADGGPA